jgi:hypothetical protein
MAFEMQSIRSTVEGDAAPELLAIPLFPLESL